MVGYIRASVRFLRDRRILLGSFIAVLLSLISVLGLKEVFGNKPYSTAECFLLVLAGLIWPTLWGNIVASILPKDEYRQGTLELLLMTPITPRRLVFAMSVAPISIATILYFAVFPAFFILFSNPLNHAMAGRTFLMATAFILVSWVTIVLSLWTAASKSTDEERAAAKSFSLAMMVFGFTMILLTLWIKGNLLVHFYFVFIALANVVIAVVSITTRSVPFSLEDMDSPVDAISKKISGLLAMFRSNQGTIFEREDGISKYETLEQIRQQSLGGPLLLERNIRDITFTALFLFSPIVLMFFVFPGASIFTLLRIGFIVVLLIASVYAASTAMKEMLEERSTLRLDSIRTTLLNISDVTRVKEWTAKVLPYTVLKWSLAFGGVWALLGHFSIESAFVVGLCAVQARLALSIATRLGLRLGLSAKDVFEGVLWIALAFVFWIVAPYLGVLFISPDYFGGFPFALFQFAEKMSPLFIVHHISFDTLHSTMYLQLAIAFFLQWLVCFGLDYLNQRRISVAWR